jgi:hypothetical protein
MTMSIAARVFFVLLATLLVSLTGSPSYAISDCVYAGVTFSDGAVACQSGKQFECSNGSWDALDLACPSPQAGPAMESPMPCRCSDAEAAACDQTGQGCCVTVVSGTCVKKCCPR